MARRSASTSTLWAALETWHCSTCGEPMPFETLPCADGHGEDCPDRVCVGCGAVLVVSVGPVPGQRSA